MATAVASVGMPLTPATWIERGAPGQFLEAFAITERRLRQQRQYAERAYERGDAEVLLAPRFDRAVFYRVAQAGGDPRCLADR